VVAADSAHVAAVLMLVAVVLMAAAPLGYRLRLWSAIAALTKVVALGLVAGALAALLALVSLATGGWQVGAGTTVMLVAIVVIGAAAVALPLRVKKIAAQTPFNDVTTDTSNAPGLEALLALRRAEVPGAGSVYDGARLAALQKRTYPDLAPLNLAAPPGDAFKRALSAARSMGWTIVAEDAARGRIEAFDKTLWFGFVDDIAIRVAPEGSGARIDMRSLSRVGISDLGKNATRIRAFFATLKQPSPASG
jgi:uncharacterized protein (DUF1499 family)